MHILPSVFRFLRPGTLPALRTMFYTAFLLAVLSVSASSLRAAPDAENGNVALPDTAQQAAGAVVEATLMPPRGGVAVGKDMLGMLDPSGKLTLDDITREDYNASFVPLDMRSLPRQAGAFWLRLPLKGLSDAELGTGREQARLDLGDQVPGSPQVWKRSGDKGVPRQVTPDDNGLYPLSGLERGGEVIVRLDGLPGLWFSPSLRSPADALNAPERKVHSLALAALTVLLMLAFVRSITERGDGRIWAGIFAGAALIQAFCGVPSTPEGSVRPADMPGILAAAIALMLLPHVGRNIMRTRSCAPVIDVLLLILALPGAALALLPMLPGQAWTARLLTLWPLGAIFALLPALALLLRREKGSLLFTLACFAMTAGSLLGLWGMGEGIAAPLWGQAPLLGVCIAALLLAAAAPRSAYMEPVPVPGFSEGKSPADLLEIETFSPVEDLPAPVTANLGEVEEALRDPLDRLMRECCALDRGLRLLEEPAEGIPPLPETALENVRRSRTDAENVLKAATDLAGRIARLSLAPENAPPDSGNSVFDLRQLVQLAFSTVQSDAAEKNLGLSWYIAPHIALRYRGDGERLSRVLAALLVDAVRATEKGNVCLRVRREEHSSNPGHLQFTISDTGRGAPPVHRSSLALAHAWELATDHGGDLFVDSTPHGVEISFSLNCTALDAQDRAVAAPPLASPGESPEEQDADSGAPLIILASDRSLNRQMFAWQLRGDDHKTWEAGDCAEAVALYKKHPASLLVLDGHMPEDDIIRAVADVRLFEGERALPLVPVLGLALDEEQGERLRRVGCEYILYHPLGRQELRDMARALLAGTPPAAPELKKQNDRPSLRIKAEKEPASASGRQEEKSSEEKTPETPSERPAHAAAEDGKTTSIKTSQDEENVVSTLDTEVQGETSDIKKQPEPVQAPPAAVRPASRHAAAVPFRVRTPHSDTEASSSAPSTVKNDGQTGRATALPIATAHPSGKKSWLASLFKPRPKLEQPAPAPQSSESDEWVGEPVPLRHSSGEQGANTIREQQSSALQLTPLSGPASRESDHAQALSLTLPEPNSTAEKTSGIHAHETASGTLEIHLDPPAALSGTVDQNSRPSPSETGQESSPAPVPSKGTLQKETDSVEALPLSNVEAMPFLSMNPGDASAANADHDEIVELTEDDILTASSFEQSAPSSGKNTFPQSRDAEELRPSALADIKNDVYDALTRGDAQLLAQSSARLRACADSFGLHTLADLAYLMQESAKDGDFEAVRLIMPDLDQLVERELNRSAEDR